MGTDQTHDPEGLLNVSPGLQVMDNEPRKTLITVKLRLRDKHASELNPQSRAVSPSKLAKTTMAKSVLDAGWADFKTMLGYKAIRHGSRFLEVSEAYSSQACSDCGSIGGPRGLKGLAIRGWTCAECGSEHDRDVNGACNILARGLASLVEGALQ